MIRRIVLTLSGNPFSRATVARGLELARAHGAEVTAVTLFDRDRLARVGGVPVGAGSAARELREHRRETVSERIREDLELFEESFGGADVPYRVVREDAEPVQRLFEIARSHDLTLVGMRGFFDYGVFRNPSSAIVRLVSEGICPILAVAQETRPVHRVLVAYNGSRESAAAMKDFVQVRPFSNVHVKVACFEAALDGAKLLEEAAAFFTAHDFDVETEHVGVPATEGLIRHANEWGADAIVLGATNRAHLARKILGDTALRALKNAEVPLFLSR